MARLAVWFTVLCLLFTFSHARFITVEPEHEVATKENVSDLPDSDSKTTTSIFLPSERSGFEPAKLVDFKHDDDDASKTESNVESIPLATIRFHPVNRHFPRRPFVPFRHKHNCRFHKRFRPLNPGFQQKRYISYGDDMILSDDRSRFDSESSGGARQIPARWVRFPDDGAESKEHVDFMKLHDHDHDHENEHDFDFMKPHDHEHENEHDFDFMMKPHDHDHDHDQEHHHDHDHDQEHHHDHDHDQEHHHDHDHDHEHDHDHDDEHHHHHHRRHRRHHHGGEEEWDEEDEHDHEHEGGFMKKLSKYFIHF